MFLGKRKYHRGRMVDGRWILGMVERESGELRLEICTNNKRDRATLIPLIKRHVAPGTLIITDCWAAYNFLEQEGFMQETVNHSQHLWTQELWPTLSRLRVYGGP